MDLDNLNLKPNPNVSNIILLELTIFKQNLNLFLSFYILLYIFLSYIFYYVHRSLYPVFSMTFWIGLYLYPFILYFLLPFGYVYILLSIFYCLSDMFTSFLSHFCFRHPPDNVSLIPTEHGAFFLLFCFPLLLRTLRHFRRFRRRRGRSRGQFGLGPQHRLSAFSWQQYRNISPYFPTFPTPSGHARPLAVFHPRKIVSISLTAPVEEVFALAQLAVEIETHLILFGGNDQIIRSIFQTYGHTVPDLLAFRKSLRPHFPAA